MAFVIRIKKIISLILVLILASECFAVAVGDNDGSAFITRMEFDSRRIEFQSKIDEFNTSIDAKIDEAIASYLPTDMGEKTISLYAYAPVNPKLGFNNVIISASPSYVKKDHQMKYSVNYQTTKIDFSSSRPSSFPIVTSGISNSYTMGVSRVKQQESNKVFILSADEPDVVSAYYPKHSFLFSGAQTFTLGWISINSIYAFDDLTDTIEIGAPRGALSIYDAGACNLTSNSKNSTPFYFRDDDTWQLSSYIPYSSNKDKCCAPIGNPTDNSDNMVFSYNVKTRRHDITDCGGNLIITENRGIANTEYIIFNDDDIKVNMWNEGDIYLEQYTEPLKYLPEEHGNKYWFCWGQGNSVMHGASGSALTCRSILRMPFLKPRQTHTSEELDNLKDVYDGKWKKLTGEKQHYSAGVPLAKMQYDGNVEFDIAIAKTTPGFEGKILIEVADQPFPSGNNYTEEFKTHLVKINKQTSVAPYELASDTKTTLKFDVKKGKIYYLRFYEQGKLFGGKISYLYEIVNSK